MDGLMTWVLGKLDCEYRKWMSCSGLSGEVMVGHVEMEIHSKFYTFKVLVIKSEGKRSLGKPRRR